MNVRLENIHTDVSPTNYVSFLSQAQRNKGRSSDRDSIHSVSSMRSVISGMSSLWSSFGLASNTAAKVEREKAATQEDIKYLYSAFTKIPCLKLAPDHKARLISGYEEFPFDSAVPLFAFKNLSALEICDVDFRQFYGWDRLAEQLRSLTVKRAGVDDPADLLINIVLDDMDKRRRRSAKTASLAWPAASPAPKQSETARAGSTPDSPPPTRRPGSADSPHPEASVKVGSTGSKSTARIRQTSTSPVRPSSGRHGSSYTHGRGGAPNFRRSSGSSSSSIRSSTPRGSSSNLLSFGFVPMSKWRFLRHLSLADNGLTVISASSLAPLANTLQSLDLSSNLFTEIPDSLATLTALRALNLSNCMIQSLRSLAKSPLPAITTLNMRGNRLVSLAGVERLLSLERLDLRDNKLADPTELARLTGVPDIQEIFVTRNPFVKTHSNYRVLIFNLFRRSPGYAADINIDGIGPGYSERKQLVDRAPELAGVPVVRPPIDDVSPPTPDIPMTPASIAQQEDPFGDQARQASSAQRTASDYAVSSQRRRKGTRRRIVELSKKESPSPPPSDPVTMLPSQVSVPPSEDSTYGGSRDVTPTRKSTARQPSTDSKAEDGRPPQLPPLDTAMSPPTTPGPRGLQRNTSMNGDLYRQKIEALRSDLGNGWLSALGEDTWNGHQPGKNYADPSLSPPGPLRPSITPTRTASQGIASGGRTLG